MCAMARPGSKWLRRARELACLAGVLALALSPRAALAQESAPSLPDGAPSHPSCEGSSDTACAPVEHELSAPPPPPSSDASKTCEQGNPNACAELADVKLKAKDLPAAEDAWLRACTLGHQVSCATLGKRRLERSEYDAAEPLLQQAADAGDADASRALLALHERRGTAVDRESAAELRAAAAALEKPDVEGVFQYRFGPSATIGGAFVLNVQPMAFWNRRITAGFLFAGGTGPAELDGFLGAQAFANELLAGYVRVLAGSILNAPTNQGLNYGAELGAKLCWGEIGHLEVSVGSSRASPMHASVGLGVNGIFLLALLLH